MTDTQSQDRQFIFSSLAHLEKRTDEVLRDTLLLRAHEADLEREMRELKEDMQRLRKEHAALPEGMPLPQVDATLGEHIITSPEEAHACEENLESCCLPTPVCLTPKEIAGRYHLQFLGVAKQHIMLERLLAGDQHEAATIGCSELHRRASAIADAEVWRWISDILLRRLNELKEEYPVPGNRAQRAVDVRHIFFQEIQQYYVVQGTLPIAYAAKLRAENLEMYEGEEP